MFFSLPSIVCTFRCFTLITFSGSGSSYSTTMVLCRFFSAEGASLMVGLLCGSMNFLVEGRTGVTGSSSARLVMRTGIIIFLSECYRLGDNYFLGGLCLRSRSFSLIGDNFKFTWISSFSYSILKLLVRLLYLDPLSCISSRSRFGAISQTSWEFDSSNAEDSSSNRVSRARYCNLNSSKSLSTFFWNFSN